MTRTEQIFQLSCPYDNHWQGIAPRVLFVCSAGLLRSATAATLGSQMGMNTRNCGSHYEYALIPISANLIYWAKKIVFVNYANYERAKENFANDEELLCQLKYKKVVWDIEDDYCYMDDTLVSLIKPKLSEILS